MARIRSLKPEFWSSEQVMECSPNARLLFLGAWNFCDDHGRHPYSPKQLKALIFPGDSFSAEDVGCWLAELETQGLIKSYVVDDKRYFIVTGWHHQKIDKPQKPKFPPPNSDTNQEPFSDLSPNGIDGIQNTEGNTEGKGKEKKEHHQPSAAAALAAAAGPSDFEKKCRQVVSGEPCSAKGKFKPIEDWVAKGCPESVILAALEAGVRKATSGKFESFASFDGWIKSEWERGASATSSTRTRVLTAAEMAAAQAKKADLIARGVLAA